MFSLNKWIAKESQKATKLWNKKNQFKRFFVKFVFFFFMNLLYNFYYNCTWALHQLSKINLNCDIKWQILIRIPTNCISENILYYIPIPIVCIRGTNLPKYPRKQFPWRNTYLRYSYLSSFLFISHVCHIQYLCDLSLRYSVLSFA